MISRGFDEVWQDSELSTNLNSLKKIESTDTFSTFRDCFQDHDAYASCLWSFYTISVANQEFKYVVVEQRVGISITKLAR
jgi:hypothetical protein